MEKSAQQILSGPLKQAIKDDPEVGKRLGEYQGKIDQQQAHFYAWIKQENLNHAENSAFQTAVKIVEDDLKKLYPDAPTWRKNITHLLVIDERERKKVNKWLEENTPALLSSLGSIETCGGFVSARLKLSIIFAENTQAPSLRDYFFLHHELGHALGWNVSVNTLNQRIPDSTNESFEFAKNFSTGLLSIAQGTAHSRGRLIEEAVVERDAFLFALQSADPELVKLREKLIKFYTTRKKFPSLLNYGEIQYVLNYLDDLIGQLGATNRIDEHDEIKREIISTYLEVTEATHYRQARQLLEEMIGVMTKLQKLQGDSSDLEAFFKTLETLPRALRLARIAPKAKKEVYQLLEKTFSQFNFPFAKKVFSQEFSEEGIKPLTDYVRHFAGQLQVMLDLKEK